MEKNNDFLLYQFEEFSSIAEEVILKVTKNHGSTILDLQTKDANLEDVFISLTQN